MKKSILQLAGLAMAMDAMGNNPSPIEMRKYGSYKRIKTEMTNKQRKARAKSKVAKQSRKLNFKK